MNEPKSARYQRIRRRSRLAGVLSGGAILALLVFTSASSALAGYAVAVTAALPGPLQQIAAGAMFVAALIVGWELVTFPLAIWLDRGAIRRRLDTFAVGFDSPASRFHQSDRAGHRT